MFGVYEYAKGVEIDLDAIPLETQANLMKTTLRHKLGNEVDAAVIKIRQKDEKTGDEFNEEYEPITLAKQQEMVRKLLDGTLGIRVGGPRGNTLEMIARELAMKQAEASLAPKGFWPKADRKNGVKAEDAVVEFSGVAMTRDDLTDVVFEKYKDKFMKEAEEEHARRMEKAKLAKQNAVKAVDKVEVSVNDLV